LTCVTVLKGSLIQAAFLFTALVLNSAVSEVTQE